MGSVWFVCRDTICASITHTWAYFSFANLDLDSREKRKKIKMLNQRNQLQMQKDLQLKKHPEKPLKMHRGKLLKKHPVMVRRKHQQKGLQILLAITALKHSKL